MSSRETPHMRSIYDDHDSAAADDNDYFMYNNADLTSLNANDNENDEDVSSDITNHMASYGGRANEEDVEQPYATIGSLTMATIESADDTALKNHCLEEDHNLPKVGSAYRNPTFQSGEQTGNIAGSYDDLRTCNVGLTSEQPVAGPLTDDDQFKTSDHLDGDKDNTGVKQGDLTPGLSPEANETKETKAIKTSVNANTIAKENEEVTLNSRASEENATENAASRNRKETVVKVDESADL